MAHLLNWSRPQGLLEIDGEPVSWVRVEDSRIIVDLESGGQIVTGPLTLEELGEHLFRSGLQIRGTEGEWLGTRYEVPSEVLPHIRGTTRPIPRGFHERNYQSYFDTKDPWDPYPYLSGVPAPPWARAFEEERRRMRELYPDQRPLTRVFDFRTQTRTYKS